MVEPSTADREVTSLNPVVPLFRPLYCLIFDVKFATSCTYSRLNALAEIRTSVSRVAGENSTTEPPMRCVVESSEILRNYTSILHAFVLSWTDFVGARSSSFQASTNRKLLGI